MRTTAKGEHRRLDCCDERRTATAGACFVDARAHRLALWRRWDRERPLLTALLLNPSVADELVLDPTLRRVHAFAERWGFGGFEIVNAFSLVSTDPKRLDATASHAANDAHIVRAIDDGGRTMAGWGGRLNRRELRFRIDELSALIGNRELWAWKTSLSGQPSHPLYVAGDTVPMRFVWPVSAEHIGDRRARPR